VVVVVEEPAVEVCIAESGLDCFQVHGEILAVRIRKLLASSC
jgi:hypothetical protein